MSRSTAFPDCSHWLFTSVNVTAGENSPFDARKHQKVTVKQHRILARKEILFSPKTKFKHLYIIERGALKTFQTEAGGKELIRGFYFSGETLGYEAISTNAYHFSAAAIIDTIVYEIAYDQFLESLHNRPMLQKQVLRLISQQLNAGAYLVATTAEQRIAAFLIDLSQRLPLQNNTKLEFVFPMSRQDMGNYLRLTGETISRVFSQFKNKKLIDLYNKHICLLKPEALKEIAEGLYSVSNKVQDIFPHANEASNF